MIIVFFLTFTLCCCLLITGEELALHAVPHVEFIPQYSGKLQYYKEIKKKESSNPLSRGKLVQYNIKYFSGFGFRTTTVLYINYLPELTKSDTFLFADDIKII